MNDYNDGKIHGWNGGDCPVHPKTVVEYWLRGGLIDNDPAGLLKWQHGKNTADIIAFRVTKVHREPKMVWVNEYPSDGFPRAYDSEAGAKCGARPSAIRIAVKYQEVIEND